MNRLQTSDYAIKLLRLVQWVEEFIACVTSWIHDSTRNMFYQPPKMSLQPDVNQQGAVFYNIVALDAEKKRVQVSR